MGGWEGGLAGSESLAAGLWDGCPGLALQCCLLKSRAEVLSVGNGGWLGVGKTRLGEGDFCCAQILCSNGHGTKIPAWAQAAVCKWRAVPLL